MQIHPGHVASPSTVEGPAFSLPLKFLATVSMLALAAASWRMVLHGTWAEVDLGARIFVGAASAVLVLAYIGILIGRCSIDGTCIRQTGLWDKEVRLAELTQVKLIDLPGLRWLIAPRLVVRCGGLGLTTFHVADAQVLAACRRLAYG